MNSFVGQKYNRLTVVSETYHKLYCGRQYKFVLCECDHNNLGEIPVFFEARLDSIKNNSIKSCGCLQKETGSINGKNHKKHGLCEHILYEIWTAMKQRCYNKNNKNYHDYGGRGITVCEEWKNDFQTFYEWAKDKWKKGLKLDRIDNEFGNYEPNNCRFINDEVSANNKRNNHKLTAFGETKNLSQWVRDQRCVVSYNTLLYRINDLKWGPEQAITQPAYKRSPEKKLTLFGETKNINEWSKDSRCKVCYSTLHQRIKQGKMTIEEVITKPPQK